MSVFPAASRSHVPRPWADLMIDPECTIIDFYPEDFKIDLNGKKYAWQGVALLPFVDEVNIHLLDSITYQGQFFKQCNQALSSKHSINF